MSPTKPADETVAETAPDNVVEPETAEAEPAAPKGVHVGAVIPADVYEVLDEYRWAHRLNKSQVIVTALTKFAESIKDDPQA